MRRQRGVYSQFLFGTPEFDVRYRRVDKALSIHRAGVPPSQPPVIFVVGDLGEKTAAMLLVLKMRQDLTPMEELFGPFGCAWNETMSAWYRCGRRMLEKPA